MEMNLQISKSKTTKSGIPFDFKTPLARIHITLYKFILKIFQDLMKYHVHVYYIVYRITKIVTLNTTCYSILIS
jgi:hypothetical protein